MTLLQPLWLILAAFTFILYLLWKSSNDHSDWQRIIPAPILRYLRTDTGSTLHRPLALLLAVFITVALANPALPRFKPDTFQHTECWFVVVDISRSMTLSDVAPSRISALRDLATQLVEQSQARSVALIAYAGDAFLFTPPSFDKRLVHEHITLLEHGLIPAEGSNLTRALSLASSVIESSALVQARVFVLGDTGGMNASSISAVSHLATQGHNTDAIVFGIEGGSDNAKIDLNTAHELVSAGGGELIRANAMGTVDLTRLNLTHDVHHSTLLQQSTISLLRWQSLAHWLLVPCLFIVVGMFIREHKC